MKIQITRLLIAAFLVVGCAGKKTAPADLQHIVFLHTNDIHGHAWPHGSKKIGGYAAQKFLVEKIRLEEAEKGSAVFVLSAGDVNTGVPESNLLHAEPDFKAMDSIGYDAMVLGNHEFDNGVDMLLHQIGSVKFPVLSANVSLRNLRMKLASPWVVLERAGVRIGVLGLTTDEISTLSSPQHAAELKVDDVIETAKKWVPEIKKKGVDFVVALTHLGVNHTGRDRNRALNNDDTKLAEARLGIPLIIGGHSHTTLREGMRVAGSMIAQAGEKGESVGRVDVLWDKARKEPVDIKATVLPVDPAQGTDPVLEKELNAHLATFEKKLSQIIGHTVVKLDAEKETIRYQESNFGNLITDIIREKTKSDVAVFNSGGIRATIEKGPVTLRQIYLALPYRNTVATCTLSGRELREVLEESLAGGKRGAGFLQVSGLSYETKDGTKIDSISIGGKPLNDDGLYRLATNNFVMAGGDHLKSITKARDIVDTGIPVDVQVIQYFKAHKKVAPKVEGRIRQKS